MNTILILTARSRAHTVKQDNKVLARARMFNSPETTPKKSTSTHPLREYICVMRDRKCGVLATHEKLILQSSLRDARAAGRAMAAAFGFYYLTTKLAAEHCPAS
jgi:hypothetical protein